MPLTIKQIKESGLLRPHASGEEGSFTIEPPLKLVTIQGGFLEMTKNPAFDKGEVVHADIFHDNDCFRYPNTIHLVEKGYWWPLEGFEMKA